MVCLIPVMLSRCLSSTPTQRVGPRQLCVTFLAQRFAVWQSALIGAAVTTAVLVVGAAVDTDLRHVNFRAARSMQRWLFKDLSGTASTSAPSSDTG